MKVRQILRRFGMSTAVMAATFLLVFALAVVLFLTRSYAAPKTAQDFRTLFGIETRVETEARLKSVFPKISGLDTSSYTVKDGIDGDCRELTDSSALAAVQYTRTISAEAFVADKQAVVTQTKSGGTQWYDGDGFSKPFDFNSKTYKVRVVEYSRPKDLRGFEITACD